MKWLQRTYEKLAWRMLGNKYGFSKREVGKLQKTKWVPTLMDITRPFYWFRVDMEKTNRCSAGWKEGQSLYFDFSGMLITRKSPKLICPHALAVISPIIYSCLDRIMRGANPSGMQINYISCTDPGYDQLGMGNNLFKITYERAPLVVCLRSMLSLAPYILFRSSKARGSNSGGLP
jgi:uncharacterized repeat protein (TIGR04076 family)